MAKFKVDHTFETFGAFWLYGQQEQYFTGTLMCRKGRVELLSALSYSGCLGETAMRDHFKGLGRLHLYPIMPSLCGFTMKNNLTLLDVDVLSEPGNTHFPLNCKISARLLRARRTVMGLHVKSGDSQSLDGCAFYFTKLWHLLPLPWQVTMSHERVTYEAPVESKTAFEFKSNTINADVVLEMFAGGGGSRKKALIKNVSRVRINYSGLRSVNELTALALRTEGFFSLFMGVSVSLKRIQLFENDETGWLVQKTVRRREKTDDQLIVRCPAEAIAGAYDKWLSVPDERRPVELVALGTLRKSVLFEETRFVGLAQSFDGFSYLRFKDGTFADRLGKCYDMLSADFAEQVLGEKVVFVRQVVDTRTYYIHIGKPIGNNHGQSAAVSL